MGDVGKSWSCGVLEYLSNFGKVYGTERVFFAGGLESECKYLK
jgi:hypothetical protein